MTSQAVFRGNSGTSKKEVGLMRVLEHATGARVTRVTPLVLGAWRTRPRNAEGYMGARN